MTRTRGVLAATLLLSAVRTGGAEPCTPRAALEGDAEAVARVAAELARLGVATDGTAAAGCRAISAAVELDRGGGIAVAVRDQSHRSEGRVVSDPALAAAWIDSWLLDDFAAPAVPATPISPPAMTAPRADVVAAAPPVDTSWTERLSLAAAYDSAWTDASARWSGVDAAACMRVGAFCFGARARYLTGTGTAGLTAASRTDLSLLATASWTREVGQMSITPEVGAGLGMLATSRIDGCAPPPPCDPATMPGGCPPLPPCTDPGTGGGSGSGGGPVYVGDNFHFAMFTPRVQLALRVTLPLFTHVWLDGTASVMLSAFAHTDPYVPAMAPPGLAATDIELPGDPTATFVLGVGLRVGAR